jgi:O-antigen/teichoic acid export membrane protein
MLAGFFNIVVGFYSAIYLAKKLTKQVMSTSVVAAIVNIIAHLALIYFIGLWAAAISSVIAFATMAIYRHYDMKKYVKITYEPGIFVKILGLFAIVSAFYYMGNIWASLAGLLVAILASIYLNHDLIKTALPMIKRKLKRT